MSKVDVLLASYNGEKYIKEQIESILNQTYKNINLLIRDDLSTDSTLKVISSLADDRLNLIESSEGSLGAAENFRALIQHSKAGYILFSDQDDIWIPEKIEKLVDFANKNFDENIPCIVYSNAEVVDENLASLNIHTYCESGEFLSLENLLFLNGGLQGCAMLINKPLRDLLIKSEGYWFMHDQVATLLAVCFGKIFFLPESLLLYRQHMNNVLGFKRRNILNSLFGGRQNNYLIDKRSLCFLKIFHSQFGCEMARCNYKLFVYFFKIANSKLILSLFYVVNGKFTLHNSRFRLLIKTIMFSRVSK